MSTEEFILNWNNNIPKDRAPRFKQANEAFDRLLRGGFSPDQAAELIVASGSADVKTADEILAQRMSPRDIRAEEPQPPKRIPTHYADVMPNIDGMILSMPAEDVMDILIGKKNRMSVCHFSSRETNDLRDLIRLCKTMPDNADVFEEIHRIVGSAVQNTIVDTEILSKDAQDNKSMRFSWSENGETATVNDGVSNCRIDLKNSTCSCDRFVLGGFIHLGLPCEHIVEALREKLGGTLDSISGMKKVYAMTGEDGQRIAWCEKASKEVNIEKCCIDNGCPFFDGQTDDFVRCQFS